MLVNLTPIEEEIERRKKIAIENNFKYFPQSDARWIQEVGIYQCSLGFNFQEDEFIELKDLTYEEYCAFPNYEKEGYGVSDNIEQIKEYYKEEIEDTKKKYVISLTPVWQDRGNKGKYDGWRWHKWGKYIGKLDTKCEYLDDEEFGDDFKYVIVFEIYYIK